MKGMWSYFLRRLLLIPLTFLCITFLVYAIMRLTPGGPIEQALLEARAKANGEAGGGGGMRSTGSFSLPPRASSSSSGTTSSTSRSPWAT